MDLTQSKLSKTEWKSIEMPVSTAEKAVLDLIVAGYTDVRVRRNATLSLLSILKIAYTPGIEQYLYTRFFAARISTALSAITPPSPADAGYTQWTELAAVIAATSAKKHTLKKIDAMRLDNINEQTLRGSAAAFEMAIVAECERLLTAVHANSRDYAKHIYTLIVMQRATIEHLNAPLMHVARALIEYIRAIRPDMVNDTIRDAYHIFERNPLLLKYTDLTLYEHQARLFRLFRADTAIPPTLVLYTAPTGTGKTLSPIGLACGKRIIFVCAARHVGLSLAKSAIAVEKRVAFAFGCESAADIRLHYFAAVDYTRNRRSGGIGKVDNSNGTKVDIMICDVKSYLVAMYYMLAFNDPDTMIMYWDEPTIAMDYDTHPLHSTIADVWRLNQIPNIVLSCATLPRDDEIEEVAADFRRKFVDAEIHSIKSHDCKKTISILDGEMKSVLPHLLFADHTELRDCIANCIDNRSLLRYFDLREIVRFIEYALSMGAVAPTLLPSARFANVEAITMETLKLYYLDILQDIDPDNWSVLHTHIAATHSPMFSKSRAGEANGGIMVTTADAYTLTDGPTIFLAENVDKVAQFCLQQARLSGRAMVAVADQIAANDALREKIDTLNETMENKIGADSAKEKKMDNERFSPEVKRIASAIEALQMQMTNVSLDETYIPNSAAHQRVWAPNGEPSPNAFIPTIDDVAVRRIMLTTVSPEYKMLLMMGIGVFGANTDTAYTEIMKELAANQHLFLVIAASDYIYGTNYPFCHGYLGKDLHALTQQKIIQSIGRIGRGNIQQEYTVRIRTRDMLVRLFARASSNPEAVVMRRLFSSVV